LPQSSKGVTIEMKRKGKNWLAKPILGKVFMDFGRTQMHVSGWLNTLTAGLMLSFALIPTPTHAQSSQQSTEPQLIPRSPEERERKYQNLHRLFLNVQVSSSSGQQAGELKPSDFTILEDHQPRKIGSFQSIHNDSARDPALIILVLDAVNNSSGQVKHFRDEVEKYLESGNGLLAHPTSIALFSDSGMKLGVPSLDRAALLKDLNQLAGNLYTSTCADTTAASECMQLAPQAPHVNSRACDPNPHLECLDHLFNSSVTALTSLAQEQVNNPGRVIVVWIGKGWPLLNEPGFTPDTPEVKGSFYRNLVTVSSALTEAQITVDAVASSEGFPIGPKHIHDSFFFQGVSDESHVSAASLSLQALAHQSGGLVLTSAKDIAGQIARCAADLESYYSLAFEYPPASQFGEYHSLEVKIDKPDIAVRTRKLYYAEQ
jgi:VWFA-related protein